MAQPQQSPRQVTAPADVAISLAPVANALAESRPSLQPLRQDSKDQAAPSTPRSAAATPRGDRSSLTPLEVHTPRLSTGGRASVALAHGTRTVGTGANISAVSKLYISHRRSFTVATIAPIIFMLLIVGDFVAQYALNKALDNELDDFSHSLVTFSKVGRHYGCAALIDDSLRTLIATNDSVFGISDDYYDSDTGFHPQIDWFLQIYMEIMVGEPKPEYCQRFVSEMRALSELQSDPVFAKLNKTFDAYADAVSQMDYACYQKMCATVAKPAYEGAQFQGLTAMYKTLSVDLTNNWGELHSSQSHYIDKVQSALYTLAILGLILPAVFILLTIGFLLIAEHYETELSNQAKGSAAKLAAMLKLKGAPKKDSSHPSNTGTQSGSSATDNTTQSTHKSGSTSMPSGSAHADLPAVVATAEKPKTKPMSPFRKRKMVAYAFLGLGLFLIFAFALTLSLVFIKHQHDSMLDTTRHTSFKRMIPTIAWSSLSVEINSRSALTQCVAGLPAENVLDAKNRTLDAYNLLETYAPLLPAYYTSRTPECQGFTGAQLWAGQRYYIKDILDNCLSGPAHAPCSCTDSQLNAIFNDPRRDNARQNYTRCTENVDNTMSADITDAQKDTRDTMNLSLKLLLISIPVVVICAAVAVFAIRYMWQLLSTFCSPIQWTLRLVLRDPQAIAILLQYMQNRHNEESLLCWEELAKLVAEIKAGAAFADVKPKMDKLVAEYIITDSPKEVNISNRERQTLMDAVQKGDDIKVLLTQLKAVKRTLYRLMETNDFAKLLEYSPFIRYAEAKNDELMASVAVIRQVQPANLGTHAY